MFSMGGLYSALRIRRHTSGAKARFVVGSVTSRLTRVLKKWLLRAKVPGAKAPIDFAALSGTAEAVPFRKTDFSPSSKARFVVGL